MSPTPTDDLGFLAEEPAPAAVSAPPWRLLVVDDEPEVHLITRMVLRDYVFEGRSLSILEAHSAAEAQQILRVNPEIAVILLDVVMETDHSGLDLVKWIRDELHNSQVRIILRTGQPGAAPEKQVILEYEINDYKSKTELTSIKLFTAITSAIRAWRDLKTIRRSKEGFQKIIHSSAEMFTTRALGQFIEGVLTQLTSLLYLDDESLYIRSEGLAIRNASDEYRIIAGTGSFQPLAGSPLDALPDPSLKGLLAEVIATRSSRFNGNFYLGFFPHEDNQQHILVLKTSETIKQVDQEIIELFSSNVSAALERVTVSQRIETTQKEIIFTLGELLESRSQETGNHVRRVATLSYLLAKEAGASEIEAQMLRMASPLHDVGKSTIRGEILNRPGPLTADELTEMRLHTLKGYEILRHGGSGVLQLAAIVALNHHERWDGLGYPSGRRGEEIPFEARVTAVTDVFDALTHVRAYQRAWSLEEAWQYLHDHAGDLFDPRLIEAFERIRPQVDEVFRQVGDWDLG